MRTDSFFKKYAAVAVALKEVGRLRDDARETITKIVQKNGAVLFVPAEGVSLKEGEENYYEKLFNVLMENSTSCIEFTSDETLGFPRHIGEVTGLKWDEESQTVYVEGVELFFNGKHAPFTCDLFNVENVEELLSFVDTYAA